jgi:SIR2-like domain
MARDIPLVLVTGAGASRDFGNNGAPLPLMGDWSELLIKRLVSSAADFRDLTGLTQGMSGPEFEAAIGKFLANAEAFKKIEDFVPLTYRFGALSSAPASEGQLRDWYANSISQVDRIISAIRGSVVEEFNPSRLAGQAAAEAYGELLGYLHVPTGGIVYATTNYDHLGELALNVLGRHPESGDSIEMRGVRRGPLDVAHLIDLAPWRSPVLHLHGKVGWYRQKDGQIECRDVQTHDDSHGVPVLMLPAPEKNYAGNDVLLVLWAQFEEALKDARRVLVLGHSLNDILLAKALKEQIPDQRKLGITLLSNEQNEHDRLELERLKKIFGDAPKYIPLRFGRTITGRKDILEQWVTEG